MSVTRRQVFIAIAATMCFGIAFISSKTGSVQAQVATSNEPAPVVVEVQAAITSTIVPRQWVPGSVASRHDARVASLESGRVVQIVEVGTDVREGEVLARLDDEALQLAVRQAEANLQRTEARREYAERQSTRLESMEQRSSIAEAQLDQARTDRDERRQESEQASVALADTRRRLRDASIRAPFDGTVAERFVEAGEHLDVGAPVLRLVNTVDLEIIARAPVAMAAVLTKGLTVQIRDGQIVQDATLRAVVPVGDAQSRQLEVRVALAASAWTIGSAVEVSLPNDKGHAAVAVPRDALVLRNEGAYVFRIDADGKAERLNVETGESQGEMIELLSGALADGDMLVTRGAERLEAGQRVTISTRGAALADL